MLAYPKPQRPGDLSERHYNSNRMARAFAVCAALLCLLAGSREIAAKGNPLNGTAPRPFYVFAHNPNKISDVEAALSQGANALEPDITLAVDGPCSADPGDVLVDWDSSFPNRPGRCIDTRFTDWLDAVHKLALTHDLALIVFDIKSMAAAPQNGITILNLIRAHLNHSGVKVNIILSVATLDDGALFDSVIGQHAQTQLADNEGVQIDSEDSAAIVINYFSGKYGYWGNVAYGDGTAGPGPNLYLAMDQAVGLRAAVGRPRAVTYVYTINLQSSMDSFIDSGVDGIITDHIDDLMTVVRARQDIVLANRDYNPFKPAKEAYAIIVRTTKDTCTVADIGCTSGTDATIDFLLEGERGSARIAVDTSHPKRMEEGLENWVTIPSKNLGRLRSLTVTNEGQGNAPDWGLQDVTVLSATWFAPDMAYHYGAAFNSLVRAGETQSLLLIPQFPAAQARAEEFAWGDSGRAYSDGSSTNPWRQLTDAYNHVTPSGTVRLAGGAYREKLTLNKPCTVSYWPGPSASGAVVGNQ